MWLAKPILIYYSTDDLLWNIRRSHITLQSSKVHNTGEHIALGKHQTHVAKFQRQDSHLINVQESGKIALDP